MDARMSEFTLSASPNARVDSMIASAFGGGQMPENAAHSWNFRLTIAKVMFSGPRTSRWVQKRV